MSPASRWSRNWTPFTTRPSRTSRQGMILRDGIECLVQGDAAFPQSFADDRARCRQAAEIVEAGDTRGGLDLRFRQALHGLVEEPEIRSSEHAVTPDVGEQKMTRLREGGGNVPQRQIGLLGPT